jgi:hypothetical protein
VRKKHRKKRCFVRAAAECPAFGAARAVRACSPSRALAGRFSPLSTTCLLFRFLASHKAKCAELRKKNRADVRSSRVCARRVRVLRHDFERLLEGIGSIAFAVPVVRAETNRGFKTRFEECMTDT